jgi:hypothetical protein
MSKIDAQQVRSQVEGILKAIEIFAQSAMVNSSNSSAPPASPSASQTPSQ